jgi:hypothetical protein
MVQENFLLQRSGRAGVAQNAAKSENLHEFNHHDFAYKFLGKIGFHPPTEQGGEL